MGYVTKLMRRTILYLLTVLTCTPDILPQEERQDPSIRQQGPSDDEEQEPSFVKRVAARSFSIDPNAPNRVYMIMYLSTLFDVLDLMNVIVDCIFLARLYSENISAYYASLLLAGLILGRLVDLRGTTLLFRFGVDWHPFFIKPATRQDPNRSGTFKNERVFAVLYCLFFTEAAVFLLEDYPSLVVYAHWMVVAFPPPVLSALDDANVALTATSLSILIVIFLAAIFSSLYFLIQREWKQWSSIRRVWNLTKIAAFLVACAFFIKFMVDMLIEAIKIVFQEERAMPSNKVAGITVCDDTTFANRREFCDEKIFVIRVVIAWLIAAIFAAFLIWKPAQFELSPVSSSLPSSAVSSAHIRSSSRQQHGVSILAPTGSSDDDNKDVSGPPHFEDDSIGARAPPSSTMGVSSSDI